MTLTSASTVFGRLDLENSARLTNGGSAWLGRNLGSAGVATLQGGTTRWVLPAGALIIGEAGTGSLAVTGGASLATLDLILGNGYTDVSGSPRINGSGTLVVDGPGSTVVTQSRLDVGRNGDGSLQILNGAHVTTTGGFDVAPNAGTTGTVLISGAGSSLVESEPDAESHLAYWEGGNATMTLASGASWSPGRHLGLDHGASLTIASGATLTVGHTVWLGNGASVTLAGGTLTAADDLYLDPTPATISGFGTIATRIHGDGTAITASGGTLTLGDPAAYDGFSVNTAAISVLSDATLELRDGDAAETWGAFTLTNGVVVAPNGIAFNNLAPAGYGVIVGSHSQPIAAPAGRVALSIDLHVGASVARVYSTDVADLGPSTTLAGGVLSAPRGLRLQAGDTLTGFGTVAAPVTLENAIIAADEGQAITLLGSLNGYGVVISSPTFATGISKPSGVVSLSQPLNVGSRVAAVHSAPGFPYLGPRVSLAGGSINVILRNDVPGPVLALPAGSEISGYGTVVSAISMTGGLLRASGGSLSVTRSVNGYGWLANSPSVPLLNPASATLSVTTPLDVGANVYAAYSAGPVSIAAPITLAAGGSLSSTAGFLVTPAGSISGTGTINGNVVNTGFISPVGAGGISATGAMTSTGSISGSNLWLLPGSSFTGSGTVNAGLGASAGVPVVASGPLSLGKTSSSVLSLAGPLVVGPHAVQLLSSAPASVSGPVTLAGGSLSASAGIAISSTGSITGHGTITAPSLSHAGTSLFSGPTDIFAPVSIPAAGKIALTGGGPTTFYQSLTLNGQIHVSTASTAVFVGPVTGAGSFTGAGTKIFESTTTIPGGLSTLTGSTVVAATASLVTPTIEESQLVSLGATLLLPNSSPSTLASLDLGPAGTLDLSNNRLSLTSAPLTLIRQYLFSQRVFSSSPDPADTRSLGYLQADSSILVELVPTGDANLDGVLNADDFALIDRGLIAHGTFWSQGDFNYDAQVNQQDYLLLDRTFGQTQGLNPGLLAIRQAQFGYDYVHQLLTAVPEPTCVLASLCLPLFKRRLRR